jgi:alpha-N-arabinofuranosidase
MMKTTKSCRFRLTKSVTTAVGKGLAAMAVLMLAAGCKAVRTGGAEDREATRVTVFDTVLNPVDSRLFGQFMERASWGEPGYDAAREPQNPRVLQEAVVEKLAWLNIPVVRWPAGSDLTQIDWRDMIDHVPGRDGPRPPFPVKGHDRTDTNAFGLDEFLALAESLNWAPLLPVRIKPVMMGNLTPEEGARAAAALVAYCNAEVGARLPEGMEDWPAIRARNGRQRPWKVPYIQVGNETWFEYQRTIEKRGLATASDQEKAEWILTCLRPYLKAIHEIDPDVRIIVDGAAGGGYRVDQWVLKDPVVRQHAAFYALHLYLPWGVREVQRDGVTVALDTMTAEEAWYGFVATPAIHPETFLAELPEFQDWSLARDLGLPLAVTEWNWNGWWGKAGGPPLPEMAKGLGAAGMLHAMMRAGDRVHLACQSMLVGTTWGITGIRVAAGQEPRILPTALVTGLYSRHHGNERLYIERANVRTYPQPLRINGIAPAPRVAFLDIVVTRRARTLVAHVINRHRDQALPVRFDVSRVGQPAGRATLRAIHGSRNQNDATITESEQRAAGAVFEVVFPARSVSVLEIPLKP